MSDSDTRDRFRCERDDAEPLAEFPSELVTSEPVQRSSPRGVPRPPAEPQAALPRIWDESVRRVGPPLGRRGWVAQLLAAAADVSRMERLVAGSRAALHRLIRVTGGVWLMCSRNASSFVRVPRSQWTRAASRGRSFAGAVRALLHEMSSRAGRALSSGYRVERSLLRERARPVVLFLSGVVVGAALVTAARWPFAAMTTTASSRERLQQSAVAQSLPAAAPGRASGEAQDEAAPGGGVAVHDSDASAASAQEDAPDPPRPYHGSLVISSEPRGAEVFLNGARVGRTPVVLDNLQVGSRAVRVRLDGHESWSRAVDVVANQRSSVVALLEPARR